MKSTPLITHLACAAVGIAIGSLAVPAGKRALADRPADSSQPPVVTRSARPPQRSAAELRVSAAEKLVRTIPAKDSYTERKKWFEDLPTSELSSLIEGLCQNIAPDGLAYQDKSLLEEALKRWCTEDRDGAVVWVKQLPAGPSKRYFMKQLMKQLYESAPEQALAMSEDYQAEDPEWSHEEAKEVYVGKRIDKAWNKPDVTAAEMLALYAELPRSDGSGGTNQSKYPENFDFQTFLDGIATWNKKDSKQPGTMPSDVLEVWAKRDPNAAAQWLLKTAETGTSVPFQDWDDIAKGVTKTSGVEAYYTWLGDLLPQTSDKQLQVIGQQVEARDAMGIADAVTDPYARDRVLVAISNRSDIELATTLLGEISSPEVKLKAIKERSFTFERWLDDGKLTPAMLQSLGLSEAQLRAVITR